MNGSVYAGEVNLNGLDDSRDNMDRKQAAWFEHNRVYRNYGTTPACIAARWARFYRYAAMHAITKNNAREFLMKSRDMYIAAYQERVKLSQLAAWTTAPAIPAKY